MTTEDMDPAFADLDLWTTRAALGALLASQAEALVAVERALDSISAAVDAAVPLLTRGGRLIYVGAGTSARIAVQDGAELLPTFGWPGDRLAFAIAGGEMALLRAVENAEDSASDGAARITSLDAGPDDVVIGVAASGNTPFTVAALEEAMRRGALTVGLANNADTRVLHVCVHPVLLETGPEAVVGSTRLKAGTAQKVALNLFSTMLMVRMGRVYRGLMVHMQATNEKLRRRAVRMVAMIDGCSETEAAAALADGGGDVKLAVLVRQGLDVARAREVLNGAGGNLRAALGMVSG